MVFKHYYDKLIRQIQNYHMGQHMSIFMGPSDFQTLKMKRGWRLFYMHCFTRGITLLSCTHITFISYLLITFHKLILIDFNQPFNEIKVTDKNSIALRSVLMC